MTPSPEMEVKNNWPIKYTDNLMSAEFGEFSKQFQSDHEHGDDYVRVDDVNLPDCTQITQIKRKKTKLENVSNFSV